MSVIIGPKDIPTSWAMCHNAECPRAAECLRHETYKDAPREWKFAKCVLPNMWANGECPLFVSNEPVIMARGFTQGMQRLYSRDALYGIRMRLSEVLGSKGTYDRSKKGERLLSPREMQIVQDAFHVYTDFKPEEIFDELIETYDFKSH